MYLYSIWSSRRRESKKKNRNDETTEDVFESAFRVASDFVRRGGDAAFSEKCTQTVQLRLYGLFKQATCGNCNEERPWSADFRGCAKWDAWNDQSGKTKEDAEAEYVAVVEAMAPNWRQQKSNSAATGRAKRKTATGGGMGVSVSTMACVEGENEEDSGREDDVFVYCSNGDIAKVLEILKASDDARATVNARDDKGMTLLHWACDRGHIELVRTLLERGANVDSKDAEGMTPFASAVLCEFDEIALTLVRAGANPDIPNNDGELASENYTPALEEALKKMRDTSLATNGAIETGNEKNADDG